MWMKSEPKKFTLKRIPPLIWWTKLQFHALRFKTSIHKPIFKIISSINHRMHVPWILACLSTKPMDAKVSSCVLNRSSGGAFNPCPAILVTICCISWLKACWLSGPPKKYVKCVLVPKRALCSRNHKNVKLRPTLWKFSNLVATQFYVKSILAKFESQTLPFILS